MTKVDLITGFLGAGKTTLIRRYAMECISRGERIGIIENDHGAINVDLMLLHRELGDKCRLEMVIGGDPDCHRRRLKTKLIAMGIDRMDRVIVEPSGIFDVEEFMDILYEEPLDHLLSLENVITVVDGEALLMSGAEAGKEDNESEMITLSPDARYILGSQLTKAGCVYLSKMERFLDDAGSGAEDCESGEMNSLEVNSEEVNSVEVNSTKDVKEQAVNLLNSILSEVGSRRVLKKEEVVCGEVEKLFSAGYRDYSYRKRQVIENGDFTSLFFFHPELPDLEEDMDAGTHEEEKIIRQAKSMVDEMFSDSELTGLNRLKGFILREDKTWLEINATRDRVEISPSPVGQPVLIAIGEGIREEDVGRHLKAYENEYRS
jgi:G3E family GTPase